ncbi:MAG: transposase, partial [Candidatus Limnocylindria bacterium]
MNSRVAASERLVHQIDAILLDGVTDPDGLAQLGRLGAQLVIQRAMEDEVTAFLGRARYAREPEARGWRNGQRPRRIQTAEGEIVVEVPQLRG